jgi:uncharacterized protein involved in exopolysaccharide biosynthesis
MSDLELLFVPEENPIHDSGCCSKADAVGRIGCWGRAARPMIIEGNAPMLLLPPPPSPTPPRMPRNVVTPFFKDLPKLVLTFVAVMGAAGFAASLMQPRYYAEALLYVRYGREYAYRSETGGAEMAPQNFEAKEVLKAEARILNAPELAGQVVERIGVGGLYPDLLRSPASPWRDYLPAGRKLSPEDAAKKRFAENMHAEAGEDGNIVAVTFAHPDPKIATRALDELIAAYMARRRTLFADQRANSLRPEVEAAHARLVAAEEALTSYRAKNGIVSFDGQRAQLLDRKAGAQLQLASAEAERKGLAERLERLRKTLAKTPPTLVLEATSGDSAALDNARQTLLQLKLEERKLLAEYKEKSPLVIEIRERIAQAERFVADMSKKPVQATKQGRNPVYDTLATQVASLEGELAAAESRVTALGQQLAAASDSLQALDAKTAEMTRLTRERDLADESYRLLATKYEETRVLDGVAARDDANVRVAQPALAEAEPKDLRPLVLGLGAVAAFVASLLVALLSDLLRRGFLTPEDLERETGLPVLAALPVRRVRPWRPVASDPFGMEGA